MPQLERFLIIWKAFYSYVQGIKQSVSSTLLRYLRLPKALQGSSFCKKMIFCEIFQVDACPNFNDFSLNERFLYSYVQSMKHSVSLTIFLYLRLPYALIGTWFGKGWFFMKYFKLVHAPTWKILHYMKGFQFLCTKHAAFGIFNIFPLSATPLCLVRYIILEKDDFFHKYFKLLHSPTLYIPHNMVRDVFIYTEREAFGICNFLCYMRLPYAL